MNEKPQAKLLESSEKDSGPFIIRTAEFSSKSWKILQEQRFFGVL